jgi:putative sigma-54 modulation protein
MQLNVSGHHIEVTDALRGYVESKIEKIQRHFDLVSDVNCILTVEKLRHKAEARVNVNGGTIYADNTEEDMYAAIDGLADKLERRVRKYKEKLVDHRAKEAHKINLLIKKCPVRLPRRTGLFYPEFNVARGHHQARQCPV